MIFSFIAKHFKFLLDAILVAGLVALFAWFDPFGWFNMKPRLQSTANLISNIRSIGQLVSAEYYGEVIASLKESKIEEFKNEELNDWAGELFVDIKYALYQLARGDGRPRRKKIDEAVVLQDPEIKRNFLYPYLLDFIRQNAGIRNDEDFAVVWYLFQEVRTNTANEVAGYLNNPALPQIDWGGFADFYKAQVAGEIEGSRRERKKEVTFIGRGWVKAGFDFGELNEYNFIYDDEKRAIHILGVEPVILDADINPWFIPEKGVQGFQLVTVKGKSSFEDALLVKSQCKAKLEQQALNAGILAQAKVNAEQSLRNFFSLALNEKIVSVAFHISRLDYIRRTLLQDNKIDYQEALVVDSVFRLEAEDIFREAENDLRDRKTAGLKSFLNQIQNAPFTDSLHARFNYFSPYMTKIYWDNATPQQIDSAELAVIRNLRFNKKETAVQSLDSLWFADRAYPAAFNDFVDLLSRLTDQSDIFPFSSDIDAAAFNAAGLSPILADYYFNSIDTVSFSNAQAVDSMTFTQTVVSDTLRIIRKKEFEQKKALIRERLERRAAGQEKPGGLFARFLEWIRE